MKGTPSKAVTPCEPNSEITAKIEVFADELRLNAHQLGTHGFDEAQFYQSGLFEGAIERIRGQNSATMGPKKHFVALVLNHMQDGGFIADWEEAGGANRHDLTITLSSGKVAAIELKGCLDGNNTNISERPPHAEEFIIWSLCQSKTSNLRKGVWSGIHTRLGADIVDLEKRIDGLIVWDWICNTIARPCPKVANNVGCVTELGSFTLPPPCLYSFPATAPSPRNNPKPAVRKVEQVEILSAFFECFGGKQEEQNEVQIEARNNGANLERKTTITRDDEVIRTSSFSPIKRR